ncbi:GYD domain-containing protein [bacterium]|nr:GYD domain-containing protein [bacterium]
MATYVALVDFTEQGIRNFRDTSKRADALATMAEQAGVKVKDMYWTVGAHDGILIMEAQDEATASAFLLSVGSLGNVRTQTMRAFDRSEIEGVISKLS